jgi:hypothetical protein
LYEELPNPGRIVILGDPGAGKTTAMLLLLIDVLAARANARTGTNEVPEGPVPAWVTLGGWEPDTAELLDYAASVLNRDYPGLAAYAGPDTARELLRSGRVALFLDGLDEMPEEVRGPALEAIDRVASRLQVVVTSRPDEYRLASRLHRLWGAAVIEVQPVGLEHACDYLLFQQMGARRAAWEKVADRMRGEPDGVAARTLRNPLALSLARDIYTHTDAHPSALLDHPTPDALLKHLLIRFLDISYPKAGERADAVRWLSWIADNLHGQRDIRWWNIPDWIDKSVPGLVVMTRIVVGVVFGIVYVLVLLRAGGHAGGLVLSLAIGLFIGIEMGFGPAFRLAWMERFFALRGLPVRFIPLLRTALERQVLRQVGAVYQFRHAELQDLLTSSEATQAESASVLADE